MEQFLSALQRFGVGRLAAIVGVAAGVAAALAALVLNVGHQPKALLYSNLDLKEAASVTQALDQAGVKYEVKGDGSTIMVDRDKVASTRLLVSGKGLVTSGSLGYELFDNASALGQTDFVQKLNQQRALEGELARTIRSLDGVTFTRVSLVLPRRQLFEDEAEPPSASVTIGFAGREPSADQVRAVQNLVAAAVPNLKPDRVTVIDQRGKTLAGGGDDSFAGKVAEERRGQAEEAIRKKIKELVEGVVGPGKARVQVTADLDLARTTTQEEKFDPDGQVVRSTQTTEEKAKENQADQNGQVSAANNIPGGAAGSPPGSTSSDSGKTEETTNYEISKKTTTTIAEPGAVKRLTVAVAVDGVTAAGKGGKPGPYTPRTAQEMQQIEQLVRSAVGIDANRGDQISVVNVRFTRDEAAEGGVIANSPLAGFDKNDIMRAAELAVLAVVAGLIIFFVARPLLSSAGGGAGGRLALAGPGGAQTTTLHAAAIPQAGAQGGQIAYDPQTGQPLALPSPEGEEHRIDIARIEGQVKASSVRQVAEFVERHPEESVSILRSWLHESA